MTFRKSALILPVLLATACTEVAETPRPAAAPETPAATVAVPVAVAPPPRPNARTAAELNTTSAAQRAEAAKPPAAAEQRLGLTVASLGDPTQPGFWIKTPLVKAAGQGRVVNPSNGKSSKVDLIPLDGPASAGSQLSLPAIQLLGISLTDLPEVEVFRN